MPDAYVPVLKLEIKGIDIDLPYAQLPLSELPEELDLQDNNLLRGMDGASITSINGCRVTNKIVQLNTIDGEYREAFQDALRFLKVLHFRVQCDPVATLLLRPCLTVTTVHAVLGQEPRDLL